MLHVFLFSTSSMQFLVVSHNFCWLCVSRDLWWLPIVMQFSFGLWHMVWIFIYYKFQWVVNYPPQDNKNIHKAYKESREDDPFELKKVSKSQLQMCQGSNPLPHAIFDITCVMSSNPKMSIYNIKQNNVQFLFLNY